MIADPPPQQQPQGWHGVRNTASPRPGFTLVELVLTVTVTTILLGGITSAILLATRAVPDGKKLKQVLVATRDVVDQMAHELYTAQSFTQRSATALAFTVPDRNADDVSEMIAYAWSGVPGDPITRQYNGGPPVAIVAQAYEFQLDYQLRTVNTNLPPTANESGETLLVGYDSLVDLATFGVTAQNWPAQYIAPSLPADAASWKLTRVKFLARTRGAVDGLTMVQIRRQTPTGTPSGLILEQLPMVEASLSGNYLWQEFSFGNLANLPPNEGLFLVLQQVSNQHSCEVQYQNKNVPAGDANFRMTFDGGQSWLESFDKSLLIQVYGTVTTLGQPQPVNHNYLTGVGIRLRTGKDPKTSVETAVVILNEPEVT